MGQATRTLIDEQASDLRTRLVAITAVLAVLNAGAWTWALAAFHGNPALLGVALVVYGLGLRHAVDADHIAAIDNVTRKLVGEGQRPVAVGFFFATGHSVVVTVAAGAVAVAATLLDGFEAVRSVGGVIGTLVSSLFLLAIAAMNAVILVAIIRGHRRARAGETCDDRSPDALLEGRGLLSRLFRPAFRLVGRSWHMIPLGLLFGLGFDTATEVAMFGVSAAQAAKGVPAAAVMVLPVLFAAGMTLVDTANGVLMLGAYDWAAAKPQRRFRYDVAVTLSSVVVAALVGGIEALGLLGDRLALKGAFWNGVAAANDHIGVLGLAIIGLFAALWLASRVLHGMTGAGVAAGRAA